MKRLIFAAVITLMSLSTTSEAGKYRYDYVTFDYFYHTLNPYGEWIEIDYDVYVWRPHHVHMSWRPYSEGRWVWTANGWYWDSYEPFGWATYHYGRWYFDEYHGWVWMPDYEWGPAWVEWRYDNNYIGWAPLPPYAHFSISAGLTFSINWHSRHHHWSFVTYHNFCSRNVNYYFISEVKKVYVFDNTKYRTNYYARGNRIINDGVPRDVIERRSGVRIREQNIRNSNNYTDFRSSSGRNNEVVSYRPGQTEISRQATVDRSSIRRSKVQTTLRTDKVRSAANSRNDASTIEKRSGTTRSYNDNRSTEKSSGASRTYSREATKNSSRTYKEKSGVRQKSSSYSESGRSYSRKDNSSYSRTPSTQRKTETKNNSSGYADKSSRSYKNSGSSDYQKKSSSANKSKSYSSSSKSGSSSSSGRSKSYNRSSGSKKSSSSKSYNRSSGSRKSSDSRSSSSRSSASSSGRSKR